MSDPMDITTTSDNTEKPDAAGAAPTKPSLRTLDQAFTNVATREQDLVNGPLLLGFGDGQEYVHDPRLPDLGLELASGESAHDSADEIILPGLPELPELRLGVPVPSYAQAMTLSTISQSGVSLTLPSGSIAHEPVHHSEEQTSQLADQQRGATFPWHYGFWWEGSRLCFGPFERRPILSFLRDFHVAFARSSFDTIMGDDKTTGAAYIEKSSNPMIAIAMEKRAEWLAVVLIDNFFRSNARQKPQKQTAGPKDQDLPSEPGNKAQSFDGDREHAKRPCKSRVPGRREGSGDEDSNGDGQGPSRAAKSSDSPYLACPFLKWNPRRYAKTCSLRFKQIRHVKYHLKNKHQQTYCSECEMIFNQTNIPTHVCNPNRPRPLDLMTKAMLLEIEAIPGSEVEWKKKQQWQRIYKVLFPKEPPCLSPYFNKEADRRLGEAEQYLRRPEVRAFIREKMESSAYESQVVGNFFDLLFSDILPKAWQRYDINNDGEPYMAQDKEHVAQDAQSSKTVKFRARDTSISHDTGNDQSQHPHKEIAVPQSCTVTGSTQSGLCAAQEQSGNITSDFFFDLNNSGEVSDPAMRGLMGICGSGNWEMPVGQNFTDPPWSAEYEVGPDLMSES